MRALLDAQLAAPRCATATRPPSRGDNSIAEAAPGGAH
jgi:hypothetical protein